MMRMTVEMEHVQVPEAWRGIQEASSAIGFNMASDLGTGSLLRTLAASRPSGMILELGTGTGLATAWLLDGMTDDSRLVSVESDAGFAAIARQYLGDDQRLSVVVADAGEWLLQQRPASFDMIFADTWHGKYLLLEETLHLLKPGGLYIIDDMLPQPNWPEGHDMKADALCGELMKRSDLQVTPLDWSTGIFICVKK